MRYLTRHLEALKDVPAGDILFRTGERFQASEVDAEYWLRNGLAREVPAEPPEPAPVRRGRRGPPLVAAPTEAVVAPPATANTTPEATDDDPSETAEPSTGA